MTWRIKLLYVSSDLERKLQVCIVQYFKHISYIISNNKRPEPKIVCPQFARYVTVWVDPALG